MSDKSIVPIDASRSPERLFVGGGEMSALMRSIGWSATPLGPPSTWSQALRTMVGLLLHNSFPLLLWWGPEFVQLYNDAYRPIPGAKHPRSMGQAARECWAEIWHVIGPMIEAPFAGAPATTSDDLELFLTRSGFAEETHFKVAYSPVPDETTASGIGGVLATVAEISEQIIGARQLRALRELGARAVEARTPEDACKTAAATLESDPRDVPFALFYLLDETGQKATLAGARGMVRDHAAAPSSIDLAAPSSWPLARVVKERQIEIVAHLEQRFSELPRSDQGAATHTAIVLPLGAPEQPRVYGFVIFGTSPHRVLDEGYRSFFELAAAQVATAIRNARAYQDERRRAEALAEIDHAKTAFFANVSHEFRTPLTLMLGPVEDGLADTAHPLPPEQRERQELVRRNALRLQKLVNTLLDFARIEAGRAQASFVPTDLGALTADLASSFRSAVENASLELLVECHHLPESVYVDPAMWEKIVLNLLSNAFKFTFAGTIRVTLGLTGHGVELRVEDTGTGIPPEEIPRIFERFHRVEGARGRSHEGSGIGLALVKELIGLHGGKIDVASKLGTGTTFTVTLPRGSAHLPKDGVRLNTRTLAPTGIGPQAFLAEAAQWSGAPGPALPLPRLATTHSAESGARILVVDDNADMRGYLERLLSPHWTVETAGDGAQALAQAQAHPPDLVLSDVMMPVMDGLALMRALRESERTRTIPVILLSARAGEEATVAGLQSGADEYLVKPFSANELYARVSAQLTVSRLRKQSAEQATRAREEALATVSHDLRSPLSAIDTAAALLERRLGRELPDGIWRKQTDVIRRSANRMNQLVGDLLDSASIEAGSLSIHAEPVAVADLIRELRESFEQQAIDKGINFSSEVDDDLPSVVLDHSRVAQALGNLISNALKFTRECGSVSLSARRQPNGIRFSVADSGAGIAREALPHLFERHWHSPQPGREGHGLGLSIVKGIVEAHGGTISVESDLGRGSTFSFLIPLEMQARLSSSVAADSRPESPREAAGSVFVDGGGEMGALIRAHDWSKTPLGPIDRWPQSLRTTVSIVLGSPDPISVLWGPEHRMIYNDQYRPIIGNKHPRILGLPTQQAFPELWEFLEPMIQGILRSGTPAGRADVPLLLQRRPDGGMEQGFFSWAYVPIQGESGEIAGLFALVKDSTRRIIGERRLGILRELSIRTTVDKTVAGVFRSVEEVLATASADLPFALLFQSNEAKARLVACAGVDRGGPAAPLEVTLDDRGVWPIVAVAAAAKEQLVERLDAVVGALPQSATRALMLPRLTSANAGSSAVLVAGLNPVLPLDDEYRSFLTILSRQISASITSADAFEQERRRAEELIELDRTKTAFFSNVSHEFRTPLTLILGPVEDALHRTDKTLSGNQLELVRRNALRLFKMVSTLLDFSRMEAGRAQATFVPTDLAAFTSDLASAFRSAVESASIGLTVDCLALPEAIYVDPEMWEKIVLNLLSNAVKYTHKGEIRVGLGWNDEHAVLTVTDTGVGIPEEELPRVFERFYRVRNTGGRSHEGTGIGLALVKELVSLHGGAVAVASTLGKGTTFTIRLPRGSAHLPSDRVERTPRARSSAAGAAMFVEEASRWSPAERGAGGPTDAAAPKDDALPPVSDAIASARILLADDNADLREYVSGLLGRVFRHVTAVADGRAALELAIATPPDLIISDVMMPGLDGFALVKALRANERTRTVPVILLSARAGEEATVSGLQSGADDYLVKPFSARELIARVRTQLEMARIRADVAAHETREAKLTAALHARDEFLSLVSHEFRTPLCVLILQAAGLARSLREGGQAEANLERTLKRAEIVERQAARLTRLVESFLDVTQLSSGEPSVVREEVDVAALAQRMVDDLADTGIEISLRTDRPIIGRWDRARLETILTQLLSNACKFGEGNLIDIDVCGDATSARIVVRDQGIGIPPDAQSRIFERFERAVSERHYGGFGLGLWIARKHVEALGGTIGVQSEVGRGAAFAVELPLDPKARASTS